MRKDFEMSRYDMNLYKNVVFEKKYNTFYGNFMGVSSTMLQPNGLLTS